MDKNIWQKDERRNLKSKSYFLVFLLTLAIFITGIFLSNQFNQKRTENIQEVENSMYIDILSSEIQFSLLEDAGCKDLNEKTVLSSELRDLSDKLSYMEKELKDNSDEFKNLKKKYELLQIKDYLLMKKLAKKCKLEPINILYFYSYKTKKLADSSRKQSYVLETLEKNNPRLRVYSFDYDLPLVAVKALLISKKVSGENLPTLVIEDKIYNKFQSLKKIQSILPKLDIIEKKYLEYSDNTVSKVETQCLEDVDCVVEKVEGDCQEPIAINIKNKKSIIEEFKKKQKQIIKDKKIKCENPEKTEKPKLKQIAEQKPKGFCDLKEKVCKINLNKN